MQEVARFLNRVYFGEHVYSYLAFVALVLGTLLLKAPLAGYLTRIGSRLGPRFNYAIHRGAVRALVSKPMEHLTQTILYFIAVNQLSGLLNTIEIKFYVFDGRKGKLTVSLGEIIDHVFLFGFIILLVQVVIRFVDFFYDLSMESARLDRNSSRQQLLPLIKEIARLSAWSLGALWILGGVFHVNVPALITGLGIGGVAIALAGKETVENFFAAFTLLSDRPFAIGDSIKLGEQEGTVERIGFRSTRMRTPEGAVVVIPNKNLVNNNVINLTDNGYRTVKITLYQPYAVGDAQLTVLEQDMRAAVGKTGLNAEGLQIILSGFEKECLKMDVCYTLPHPLPAQSDLQQVKHLINKAIYSVMSRLSVPLIPVPPPPEEDNKQLNKERENL